MCFFVFLLFCVFRAPGRKNKKKLVKGGREESKIDFIFGTFVLVPGRNFYVLSVEFCKKTQEWGAPRAYSILFLPLSGPVTHGRWTNLCTIWLKTTPNLRGKTRHRRRAKLAAALRAVATFGRRGCRVFPRNFGVISGCFSTKSCNDLSIHNMTWSFRPVNIVLMFIIVDYFRLFITG